MDWTILIAHADGEEDLAERLAAPLRQAGYQVVHRGTVLVGESFTEEAAKVLAQGGPVVLCGTVKAVGTPYARRLVNAARPYAGVRVFVVQMDRDADVEMIACDDKIACYWQDATRAMGELLVALHRHYPVLSSIEPSTRPTDDLLRPYLEWLVRQHATLELRGIRQAGQSPTVDLERVFVALRGGPSSPDERLQSRLLIEAELRESQSGLDWEQLSDQERRMWRWQRLAHSPLMPSLLERDRPALFADRRPETLTLGECFRRNRWLVILGDPGSGKTTLSRWLTLKLARAMLDGHGRLQVPAHQVDPAADDQATPVDLGPARLPVLLRVAEFAEARQKQPDLLLADFLGRHTWLGEAATFAVDHPRQGERLPPGQVCTLIKEHLRTGRAVVLLDGLDEIPARAGRDQVVRAIETFIRDWIHTPDGQTPFDDPSRPWRWTLDLQSPLEAGGNQLVVTSRIAGYHDSPLSGYLTHYTIEPMPAAAIDRFCEAWTGAVHRLLAAPSESQAEIQARARREAAALKAAIHDPHRPGIGEMATNPLLLMILALVHHNSQARLPEQRVRLYQIAVENLVEVWRETGLSEDEVVNVLGPLAAHIHTHYATGLIPEPELRTVVTTELAAYRGVDGQDLSPAFREVVDRFLQTVREQVGLLAARGEYLYGFLHLTFQEYLAARYLVRDPTTACKEIGDYIPDPRWREPVLLALGFAMWHWGQEARQRLLHTLLDYPDPLADLLPRHALLLAAALPEFVHMPPLIVAEVTRRLLAAYADRRGGARFDHFRAQIETALERLHRGEAALVIERILASALSSPPPEASAQRLAAATVVARLGYFSPALAGALLDALPYDDGSWDWPVNRALRALAARTPDCLPPERLSFRQALCEDAELENRVAADLKWQQLLWALCGGLDGSGAFHARSIHCQPSLAHVLLPALQRGEPVSALAPALWSLWRKPPEDDESLAETVIALTSIGEPMEKALTDPALPPGQAARAQLALERLGRSVPLNVALLRPLDKLVGALVVPLASTHDLLPQAVLAIQGIQDDSLLTAAIASLNTYLDHRLRPAVFARMLATAQTIQNELHSTNVLRDLVPHLAAYPNLLEQALAAATAIRTEVRRATVLCTLAPHLAPYPRLLSQALAAAESIRDQWVRTAALRDFARHVNEEQRQTVLTHALTAAQAVRDEQHRASALLQLASHLSEEQRTAVVAQAMAIAQAIPGDAVDHMGRAMRADSLRELTPYLPEGQRPAVLAQALTEAQAVHDNSARAIALRDLASHLAAYPDLLAQALTAARVLPLESRRAAAIRDLAPHLAPYPDLLTRALTAAQGIQEKTERAATLRELVPCLAEEQRPAVLARALAAVQAIRSSSARAIALGDLAPHLAAYPDLLAQALASAKSMKDERRRSSILLQLAPYLPSDFDLLGQALAFAETIVDEFSRADTLRALAPRLAPHSDLLAQALAAAQALQDEPSRVSVLCEMMPYLREKQRLTVLAQALASAQGIHNPSRRTEALRGLACHMAEEQRPTVLAQALAAAQAVQDEPGRATALSELIPQLAPYPDLLDQTWVQAHTWLVQASPIAAALGLLDRLAPAFPWDDLATPDRRAAALERIQIGGRSKGIRLSTAAAQAVQGLVNAHDSAAVHALLPLVQDPEKNSLPRVRDWLAQPDPALARHAALLLAEAGELPLQALSPLLDVVEGKEGDRPRCRACLSLHARSGLSGSRSRLTISEVGQRSVEALTLLELKHHHEPQISTVLTWALEEFVVDKRQCLDYWVRKLSEDGETAKLAESALSHIRHITEECWLGFSDHLQRGPAAVQAVLLMSVYRLLQSGEVPTEHQAGLTATLHTLISGSTEQVLLPAIKCLGFIKDPSATDYALLFSMLKRRPAVAQAASRALAVLAAGDTRPARGKAERRLRARQRAVHEPLASAIGGAMVYLWIKPVSAKAQVWDPTSTLDRLADVLHEQPDRMLSALLAAGTDDVPWSDYHDRATRVAQALLTARPNLLPNFLDITLPQALAHADWPERRMVIAVAAAAAEALPAPFAQAADSEQLEPLLVRSIHDVESFSVRRFGLTTLSHLRRVTPAVMRALRAGLSDVSQVQQHALRAVLNFRHVEGDLIPQLVSGLVDDSAAFAYATAQVLAALGRAENSSAEQRQAILMALADAIRSPAAEREVYVLEDTEIRHLGRLDQALHRALLQVAEGVR